MKKILLLSLTLVIIACKSTAVTNTHATQGTTSKQKNTVTQQAKKDILIGVQTRSALEQEPFGKWFLKNYKNYKINTETISQLSPKLKDVTIKAFMGTWCGDSKRETPTFYKILDAVNYDYNKLELITVARNKTTPNNLEKGFDIIRVPTFIFYKDGKEIGRYVEYARESLEKDMLAILSGENYKHSYEN